MHPSQPRSSSNAPNSDGLCTVSDSFGSVSLPKGVLWGAQTARSLQFFAIGEQRMPIEIIHALALIKWAAACVNGDLMLPKTAYRSTTKLPSC